MTQNELTALHFAVNFTLNGVRDQLAVNQQTFPAKKFPHATRLVETLEGLARKLQSLGGPKRAEPGPGDGAEPGD